MGQCQQSRVLAGDTRPQQGRLPEARTRTRAGAHEFEVQRVSDTTQTIDLELAEWYCELLQR
jgi:hypothetical protein